MLIISVRILMSLSAHDNQVFVKVAGSPHSYGFIVNIAFFGQELLWIIYRLTPWPWDNMSQKFQMCFLERQTIHAFKLLCNLFWEPTWQWITIKLGNGLPQWSIIKHVMVQFTVVYNNRCPSILSLYMLSDYEGTLILVNMFPYVKIALNVLASVANVYICTKGRSFEPPPDIQVYSTSCNLWNASWASWNVINESHNM